MRLLGLRCRSVQPQRAVDEQLTAQTVEGGADGEGQDNTDGDQLRRDFLELAEALGDGVGCV